MPICPSQRYRSKFAKINHAKKPGVPGAIVNDISRVRTIAGPLLRPTTLSASCIPPQGIASKCSVRFTTRLAPPLS